MKKFDVFVFGTGTAGKLVANTCKEAGMSVAIIDNREYGGTCSQRGCDPKKLILASVEAFNFAKDMTGDGIDGTINFNWNDAMNYAHRYTKDIPDKTEHELKDKGITCLHGEATFIDPETVILDGEKIKAAHFVIATGMTPLKLGIPGEKFMLTSGDFFKLKEVPEKVVFVGAGYIGMEFGQILARAGSKVTMIQKGEQILAPFEEFTARQVENTSEQLGIKIIKNAQASSVEQREGRYIVNYSMEDGMHQITTDCVFNTAGRVPATSSLDLEKANIVSDKNGVVVNEFLQSTSQPHIYACGDVSSKNLPLTPLSSIEATVVAKNLIGEKVKIDTPAIPSTVFTIPQCAGIGLTELQAKKENRKYKVLQEDGSEWFNNKRINAKAYAYKIILDKENGLIIGAHIVGPEASEQINMIAIAMKAQMTFKELRKTIFNYPSWGNDFKGM
ncbi:dihydrolipoyl dehydrogenase family protein [Nonlabens sp. Asnod2-A12]|uniref:dihydrolipoyl dehydrogenase family protein n=1 Tax=Nonlabens sp. Asnod2-A12 TaxID=3160578 RepID=UPI00386D6D88